MSVQAHQDRALYHYKPPQRSHSVPQKTPTANRNKEMPRHESAGNPHPKSGRLQPLAGSGRAGRHVQDTHPDTRGFSNPDGAREAATGWRMQAQDPCRHGLGSRGERPGCSLPSSERSIPLPRRDKHPLPALNQLQRGWGGTERQRKKKKKPTKPLERKTHFLRQKKKIKSGFIKVNFTGERRERAKHNVLEISSARLRPRKQDKAASAVSAGVHWGELGPGAAYRQSRWVQTCWKTSSTEPSALSWVQRGQLGDLPEGSHPRATGTLPRMHFGHE